MAATECVNIATSQSAMCALRTGECVAILCSCSIRRTRGCRNTQDRLSDSCGVTLHGGANPGNPIAKGRYAKNTPIPSQKSRHARQHSSLEPDEARAHEHSPCSTDDKAKAGSRQLPAPGLGRRLRRLGLETHAGTASTSLKVSSKRPTWTELRPRDVSQCRSRNAAHGWEAPARTRHSVMRGVSQGTTFAPRSSMSADDTTTPVFA